MPDRYAERARIFPRRRHPPLCAEEPGGLSAEGILVEAAGWGGALLILGGYLLLSAGKLEGRSRAYQAMNVIGAAGFAINGVWHGALPSAVLNIVWMMIGAVTLWRIAKRDSST